MGKPGSIISLVPSLTELLFDLGLGDRVTGRTRFCVHPMEKVSEVEIVGGTKNPRINKILSLQPDLVIANREENKKEDIERLSEELNVMITEIDSISDALLAIHDIGKRCDVDDRASELISQIRLQLDRIPDEPVQTVAYFIWRDPWMTVGADTYIHSVLEHWNLKNVYKEHTRYPETTLSELRRKSPDLILLSTEPFPFKEKHKGKVRESCPDSRVLIVDGEWFSWYGSRMLPAFKKLNRFRKAIS